MLRSCFAAVLLLLLSIPARAAVILQYHHVADNTPAATSVSVAQFAEHMAYLAANDFKVVPLSRLVEAIREGTVLSPKTVAITFDDGYQNIADNADPILKQYGFPYTLFVAIEPMDKGFGGMMSRETLKRLAASGVDLANHSYGHEHLIRRLPGEDAAAWLARMETNILNTEAEIEKISGKSLKLFAYPYGEYNADLQLWLEKQGFVAFGQQSGAAGKYSALTALPRFPVGGRYADLGELKTKLSSLNMPVLKQNRSDPQLAVDERRPLLELTLDTQDFNPLQMMCYVSGQGPQKPEWLDGQRMRIQAARDLPPGRSRYNCTAPSRSHSGYYWFSQAWVRPMDNGEWPQEP
ncbi:polysaccharide deacetylase family protein [Shewanella cyperi]|uniref:Polysaccharide deacetylase family protein n=1 Tax=Shewanella cyperi TaxID=2814292 RepID=A0A974XT99_9GAMM|nr:polysaccharide deacetylase family protein [Shewanella cyperi]QSX29979.1 polysaccharide deacetylase family protein [Shewanella cyperi]